MRRFLILAVMVLIGTFCSCDNVDETRSSSNNQATGWVRSVWGGGSCCNAGCEYTVVFEKESGEVFSIPMRLQGAPPVWVGMHCIVQYTTGHTQDCDFDHDTFLVVKRLPD
jgi:hypothetical protein